MSQNGTSVYLTENIILKTPLIRIQNITAPTDNPEIFQRDSSIFLCYSPFVESVTQFRFADLPADITAYIPRTDKQNRNS